MQLIRTLSIDIAIGAAACSFMIAHYLKVNMPYTVYVTLSLAVWLIYTFDHLMDARKVVRKALIPRHRFHQKYFNQLLIIWLVVFLLAVWFAITFLPIDVLKTGILIGGGVIAYFIMLRFFEKEWFFQKELFVAFVYTVGVMLGPVVTFKSISAITMLFFLQLFIIALINLLAFSWFEEEEDVYDQHFSIIQRLKANQVVRIIIILFVALFCIIVCTLFLFASEDLLLIEAVFFLMALSLAAIIWKKTYFKFNERYRFIGDGIFLFPLIFLLSYVV